MIGEGVMTEAGARQETGRRLAVTVLYGGPSAERAVSLDSGAAVADALRRRGYTVHMADISPDDLAALDATADVVFPALHGTFGEDGQLQAILESRGIPFVGSGSTASALAIDKVRSKELAVSLSMATPEWQCVSRFEDVTMAPPVVVKPVDQGSSVLTSIVREPEALPGAVRAVLDAYGRALLERQVIGDEFTVGILDGRPLPPICVRPRRQFYDYDAKYADDATEYVFDAGDPALRELLIEKSMRVFDAAGGRDLGRVDWMVDAAGTPWFLEVNTLPGFTSHSLVPMAARHVGISFEELVERLVRMAWERRT